MSDSLIPLAIYLINNTSNDCSGISFKDSSPLKVCEIKHICNHKVFVNEDIVFFWVFLHFQGSINCNWYWSLGYILSKFWPSKTLKIKRLWKAIGKVVYGYNVHKCMPVSKFLCMLTLVWKLLKNMKTSAFRTMVDMIM